MTGEGRDNVVRLPGWTDDDRHSGMVERDGWGMQVAPRGHEGPLPDSVAIGRLMIFLRGDDEKASCRRVGECLCQQST